MKMALPLPRPMSPRGIELNAAGDLPDNGVAVFWVWEGVRGVPNTRGVCDRPCRMAPRATTGVDTGTCPLLSI
jgi:hypothetical protein